MPFAARDQNFLPRPPWPVVDVVKPSRIITVTTHFRQRFDIGNDCGRIARHGKINRPTRQVIGSGCAALAGIFKRPAMGGMHPDRPEPARNLVERDLQFKRRAPTGVIPGDLRRAKNRTKSTGPVSTSVPSL